MVVVELQSDWESEGFDRPVLDLPGKQNELVAVVAGVNANIVVAIQSISLVQPPNFFSLIRHVPPAFFYWRC